MNEGQEKAFQLAKEGYNLFITGAAGTGKSYLLRLIIKELSQSRSVAVTASTGTAAYIIEGVTLHSWLGLGLAKEPVDILLRRITRSPVCSKNIRKTQTLVIDEISQVRGDFLDKIDSCCRHVRRNGLAFGGMQVIVCGDFAQLPPVMKTDIEIELEGDCNPERTENGLASIDYAFKSKTWKDLGMQTVYLREVVRQRGDLQFIEILNNLRKGCVSDEDFKPLLACIGRRFYTPGTDVSRIVFPTRLVPTNAEAFRINRTFYASIDSPEHLFHANFTIKRKKGVERIKQGWEDRLLQYTKTHGTMESVLPLKIGTRVILTQNVNVRLGLYNGAQAIIERFVTPDEATTQGFTLVGTDPGSRVNCEKIGSYDVEKIRTGERSSSAIPVIRLMDGKTKYALIQSTIEVRSDFEDEPKVIVLMTQYPLKYAWGLTIHKSQGMTLSRATIDVGKFIFSPGQTYTALSRVCSLEGLCLVDFDPNKVLVDPGVVDFYQSLA